MCRNDAIVVVDTGHAGMWMGGMFDLTHPTQSYIRSAGHLGWAFPAGLGAKCAAPDRPVVTFTGDAGFWYHIAETRDRGAVEHQRGDGGQQQRRRQPVEARLRPRLWRRADPRRPRELWTFNTMNFARLAEDMGASASASKSLASSRGALERALKADRPVVIDVVTDIEALAPLAVS